VDPYYLQCIHIGGREMVHEVSLPRLPRPPGWSTSIPVRPSPVQGCGRRGPTTPTVGGKPLHPGTRCGCSALPAPRAYLPRCAATRTDWPNSWGRSGCACQDGGLLSTELMSLLRLGMRWSPKPCVPACTPGHLAHYVVGNGVIGGD